MKNSNNQQSTVIFNMNIHYTLSKQKI